MRGRNLSADSAADQAEGGGNRPQLSAFIERPGTATKR